MLQLLISNLLPHCHLISELEPNIYTTMYLCRCNTNFVPFEKLQKIFVLVLTSCALSQLTFTCSKSTMEASEHYAKSVKN